MRITLTRLVSTFLIFLIFALFWLIYNDNNENKRIRICQQSDAFMKQLHEVTDRYVLILLQIYLYRLTCFTL